MRVTRTTTGLALIAIASCGVDTSVEEAATLGEPLKIKLPPLVYGSGATSVGTTAFTANGQIKPDGRPTTYFVEFGPTKAYGSRTQEKELPPRLAAHYRETFDDGLAGWYGGVSTSDLAHVATGGKSGGFARYTDHQGASDDSNHFDGIGLVHLPMWSYTGTAQGFPSLFLGGGDLDLRDAEVSLQVRGTGWQGNGSELVFWTQSDISLPLQDTAGRRIANWAHTGFYLTDALSSGSWQSLEYRLLNDSRDWTYSGRYGTRETYTYWPLDESLAHVSDDVFHNLVFVRLDAEPSGSIDFDGLEITYRNHNLLLPSNGARLVSSPPSSTAPSTLTDGWRNGPGREWESKANPTTPLEFLYDLDEPVSIMTVQIHQSRKSPSKEVEVLVSPDGTTWTSLNDDRAPWTLPQASPLGANHSFLLRRSINDVREPVPLHQGMIRHVKVRILSGYGQRWGLGEIELFGIGAKLGTEKDWYHVSQDITGLAAGATYHYRFVAKTENQVSFGPDGTFAVPTGDHPETFTGGAIRINNRRATLTGRLNPLGKLTRYYFEYGMDTSYGRAAPGTDVYAPYGGLYDLPRSVTREVDGLLPGVRYHYRLVASTEQGLTYGEDASFVAK